MFNALISSAFLALYGFFHPGTPQSILLIGLFVGGFFRSLQFTALNALAYADVAQERMSSATSLSSVAQQLALSCGVAVAAAVVEATRRLSPGGAIDYHDFPPAFFVVAAISAASALIFFRLPHDAGAALAGAPAVRNRTEARNGPF